MPKNKFLSALNSLGQSIWYDNLSRDVLRSGELASLIAQGVSGLTSNPTIFKKAIADTTDYDAEIQKLGGIDKLGKDSLCEELMVLDVAAAADLLKPTFEASKGTDGFASIEVSPFLAQDTQATITAAERLWGKLNRPNIMIKIPATPEGIPAIEETLSKGINVNITLIFSVKVYESVTNAFIKALERRAAKGQNFSSIASVASFFVSRVDALTEKRFEEAVLAGKATEADKQNYFGKVGIANSKLAYAKYEEIFKGPRFLSLRSKGAQVQRPLWASTGTKHPALSPVLYIEELAGRDTVNTLPPQTLKVLLTNAKIEPKLHSGLEEAQRVINGLSKYGINFDKVLEELQVQGVKLFADSYRELLDSLEAKSKKIAA